MEFITKSAKETKELGQRLGTSLKGGGLLALTGELGSGKTTFVQGLAKGVGVKERIISPTFILMRKHGHFYHLDLYRLETEVEKEVENLGIKDLWDDPQNIIIIEWAEKIKKMVPKRAIWIKFEDLGGDKRKITIEK